MSHCEVTFFPCWSVRCARGWGRGARTVERDGDAFRQDVAVRADEDGHLAQRVQLQQLGMVLRAVLVGVDNVQLQALRFRDGERGGGARVGLDRRISRVVWSGALVVLTLCV